MNSALSYQPSAFSYDDLNDGTMYHVLGVIVLARSLGALEKTRAFGMTHSQIPKHAVNSHNAES